MYELAGTARYKLEELKRCWLGDAISGYLEHRAGQGYRRATLQRDMLVLLRLAAYLRRRGQSSVTAIPQWIDRFAGRFKSPSTRQSMLWLLRRFVKHLKATDQLPLRQPNVPSPRFFKYVSTYERYLREQRGLAENTIAAIKAYCLNFMRYAYAAGIRKFGSLRRSVIEQFIKDQAAHSSRLTIAGYCSTIRGFLHYLYGSGQIRTDFSVAVVQPRIYRHERAPRFLTALEVEAVLQAVDVNTAIGRRDYAILLMLSTYGLRGSDVVRLRLEEIGWRAQTIQFCHRKGGQRSLYPLTPALAEALVAYLQDGRPLSRHREVFLWENAPFRPLSTTGIRHVVKKHLRKTGLPTQGKGAHTFRYSCAQRMFEHDFSLKVIGDFLGHRNPDTTLRYMKIDFPHLRSVALNDGEDML
jgi:integrase/recombinase XerD